MRKGFDTEFMAKVALEAIWEEKTLAELSSQYEVHKTQIAKWRKRAIRREGICVGRERVQRCMRLMDLRAIYPKRRLSQRHPGHKIYPYLLRDRIITHPNQIWATDITYIRLRQGFVYFAESNILVNG